MTTKYAINTYNDGKWTDFCLFTDACPLENIIDFARVVYMNNDDFADVAVIDTETGEVMWNGVDADDYDEPGDIDNDCGFDPYMGCFTDDC